VYILHQQTATRRGISKCPADGSASLSSQGLAQDGAKAFLLEMRIVGQRIGDASLCIVCMEIQSVRLYPLSGRAR
jgi:hypothetical protein